MASTDNVNRLRAIEELGQSVWIDNLNRELLDEGGLLRLIEEDGISGVTSNPTIFEKGMGHSDRYDDAFRAALEETDDTQEIFERLAHADVRDAADLLRPAFDGSERPRRLRLVRAAGRARPRRERLGRGGSEPPRAHRPAQRADQGAGHRRRGRGLRGADRPRRERERDAAVRGLALRADRRGVPARDRAARGRRRARGPRRLGGQLLRLARGHQGRRRAGEGRPRGSSRPGCGGQRQARLRVVSAASSPASAGSAWPRPAPRRSARCGARPPRRTPTIRTRSTWTS